MSHNLLSYREALQIIEETIELAPPSQLSWRDSFFSALAEDVFAQEDMPSFSNSAMDGYAVHAQEVASATPENPAILKIIDKTYAGDPQHHSSLPEKSTVKIMTGAALPEGADAVVKVEDTAFHGDNVQIFHSVRAGENIRCQGEEHKQGDKLLSLGQKINHLEQGVLANQGITYVNVRKPPVVALMVTGDEIVEPEEKQQSYQIRNVNTYTLRAEAQRMGCQVINLGIVKDNPTVLQKKIETGLTQADFLITSGGVSAGERDYLPQAFQDCGIQKLFHKIAVKPGKPLFFGQKSNRYIFGLPGNVVSGLTCFHLMIKPAIRRWMGRNPWRNQVEFARIGKLLHNPGERTHFVRCRLSHSPNGMPIAFPLDRQGSGMLTSMVGADGFAILPADVYTFKEFSVVEYLSMNSY